MKTLKLCVLILLTSIFSNCNDIEDSVEETLIVWNLKNISGGFSGVSEDFESGLITWGFSDNGVLTIAVDDSEENRYTDLASGTYDYFIEEIDSVSYLFINNNEYGSFTVLDDELVIDGNDMSLGSGSDFFVLQFER